MSVKPLLFTLLYRFLYSKNQTEITSDQISQFQAANFFPTNITSYISKSGHRFKLGDQLLIGHPKKNQKFDFILSSTLIEIKEGQISKVSDSLFYNEQITIKKISICENEQIGYCVVIGCYVTNSKNLSCRILLEQALKDNEISF